MADSQFKDNFLHTIREDMMKQMKKMHEKEERVRHKIVENMVEEVSPIFFSFLFLYNS